MAHLFIDVARSSNFSPLFESLIDRKVDSNTQFVI
jgi:hypothetical protein